MIKKTFVEWCDSLNFIRSIMPQWSSSWGFWSVFGLFVSKQGSNYKEGLTPVLSLLTEGSRCHREIRRYLKAQVIKNQQRLYMKFWDLAGRNKRSSFCFRSFLLWRTWRTGRRWAAPSGTSWFASWRMWTWAWSKRRRSFSSSSAKRAVSSGT